MALLMLPRVVLTHLKAGFRAALRPDPVMIVWWTQPALPTPVKQCRPSLTPRHRRQDRDRTGGHDRGRAARASAAGDCGSIRRAPAAADRRDGNRSGSGRNRRRRETLTFIRQAFMSRSSGSQITLSRQKQDKSAIKQSVSAVLDAVRRQLAY